MAMAHREDCPCPACRYRRGEGKGQAPQLSIRLDPKVRDYLLGHPEGARATVERLVAQDQAAAAAELDSVVAELATLRETVRELEGYRRAYQQLQADHADQGRELRQLAFDFENTRAALQVARHGLEQFAQSQPGHVYWTNPESLPVVARSVLQDLDAKLSARPLPRARRRRS